MKRPVKKEIIAAAILAQCGFPIYIASEYCIYDLAMILVLVYSLLYGAEKGFFLLAVKELVFFPLTARGIPIELHMTVWGAKVMMDMAFMHGVFLAQNTGLFSCRRMKGLKAGVIGQGILSIACSVALQARAYAWIRNFPKR